MLIIDRFEGDWALIETRRGMLQIAKEELPPSAREGDVLRLSVDAEETRRRLEEARALTESLDLD